MKNDKLGVNRTSLEITIIELDERLDMAYDPSAVLLALNVHCPTNVGCNVGCNTVAGCGKPAPNQG
jgi:hypothetical protein